MFEWADALLVLGHEVKGASTKEVSHHEYVQLFALKWICKVHFCIQLIIVEYSLSCEFLENFMYFFKKFYTSLSNSL